MSFTRRFSEIVITPLANNTWELLDRVPTESESGWDSMRDTWLLRNDTAGTDPLLALIGGDVEEDFGRGVKVSPDHDMWITARAAKVKASGLFVVEVTSMGLLSARGYKVTYDAAAASQTAENVSGVPDPPPAITTSTKAKLATREGGVTATFEYVAVASVLPGNAAFPTAYTGRARALPAGWEPSVPASIWSSIGDPTYHYPNGWVFEGVTAENLPGLNTVFLMKEKYIYQHAETP